MCNTRLQTCVTDDTPLVMSDAGRVELCSTVSESLHGAWMRISGGDFERRVINSSALFPPTTTSISPLEYIPSDVSRPTAYLPEIRTEFSAASSGPFRSIALHVQSNRVCVNILCQERKFLLS